MSLGQYFLKTKRQEEKNKAHMHSTPPSRLISVFDPLTSTRTTIKEGWWETWNHPNSANNEVTLSASAQLLKVRIRITPGAVGKRSASARLAKIVTFLQQSQKNIIMGLAYMSFCLPKSQALESGSSCAPQWAMEKYISM